MVLALMRRASFLELFISSITEIGRTFPAVQRELNSRLVVKPTCEKTMLYLEIGNILCVCNELQKHELKFGSKRNAVGTQAAGE